VARRRPDIPDRKADREPTVEPGVREEDLAGGVHGRQEPLVRPIEEGPNLGLSLAGGQLGRAPAQADSGERHWRQALEVRLGVDRRGQVGGQPAVGVDPLAQPLEAEVA
jgi:hypothetical protein